MPSKEIPKCEGQKNAENRGPLQKSETLQSVDRSGTPPGYFILLFLEEWVVGRNALSIQLPSQQV
jgi:hypothetical protein